MDERLERVLDAVARNGATHGVLTSPAAVAYATGFAPFAGAGPSPFDAGPPAAIVSKDRVVLVAADADADAHLRAGVEVHPYHSFAPAPWIRDPAEAYRAAVLEALEGSERSRPVAVERSLPVSLAESISDRVTIDEHLRWARMTKTAEELNALRRSAELASHGQTRAGELARPGVTELELFAEIRRELESAAGQPVALGADLLSGERTLEVMGPPSQRVLRHGDPVLCDLVPRLGVYWGDSSTTPVVGEPSPQFERVHAVALAALEHGVASVRPGMTAGELDASVRDVIERAGFADPIHVGHGIGVTNFEAPRIVPGEPTVLEEGMILMLEPTVVDAGVAAARLEWMIALEAGGAEVLSTHEQLLTPTAEAA
jgi:Xaa-Pro aminopeptidase